MPDVDNGLMLTQLHRVGGRGGLQHITVLQSVNAVTFLQSLFRGEISSISTQVQAPHADVAVASRAASHD